MSEETREYSASELMITIAARELAGARVVFVGIGLPNIACNLAQRTVAPDLELVYEAGVYGARPSRLPLSIGDPCLVTGATSIPSMPQLFQYYLQGGLIEAGFLGTAQIDRFGNINTTIIGKDYADPKVRLPGSGGACDIAAFVGRYYVVVKLSKRTFVEKVDFITSTGYIDGGDSREKLGLPGGGPEAVITDKCVFRFEKDTGEMVLDTLYPGVAVDEVRANVGWELKVSDDLKKVEPPTAEELRIIREELDLLGIYRK